MDGFDLLKEAFNKFANKFDVEDLTARAARSVAAGGKAAVDKGLQEFPQDFVKGMVQDVYDLLTSEDVADGISMTVRSFDEEKVKDLLDGVVAQLQQDEVAGKVAKQMKDLLQQASNEDIENALDGILSDRSVTERMIAKAIFSAQVLPILEDLRSGDEEEIKEKIKELAATIPTDIIALQAAALTQEITPDRIMKQAHDIVGKLPSPTAVADIAHAIGKNASDKFDRASKAKTLGDALSALQDFATDAADIVSGKVANDTADKGKFGKKGGGFKL